MYNVTLDTPSEQTTPGFMDAGIHENVELTKVSYGVGKNGSEFLAFHFMNEDGEVGTHTEYKPNENTSKDITAKELNQISRVKQIVKTFVPEANFIFQAKNFKEFAEKTIKILGNSFEGVKIRVKFVYTSNGRYTSLPNYWQPRFIERMDNNGYYGDKVIDKSKIKVLSIDNMKRVTSDPIPSNTNPFASTSDAPVNNTSDLPF